MREIKFRGKSVINGKWVYGSLETFTDDKQNYARIKFTEPYTDEELGITIQRGCDYLVDPETVGQFTGLYDKNGKEIYESDIVRKQNINHVGKVIYDKTCAAFILNLEDNLPLKLPLITSYTYNDGHCTVNCIYDYEVIGNIHDNPELMKGGEK